MNIVNEFRELPIQHSERKRTDVFCTIIGVILALILFILACVFYNNANLIKWRYPTDSSGKTCGKDHYDFPFLYYASIQDTTKRLCLSQCPKLGYQNVISQQSTCENCIINNKSIDIYDTNLQNTMMGKFCLPSDQKIKDYLVLQGGIQERYGLLQSYKSIVISLLVSFLIGSLFASLVQFFPRIMINLSVIGGGSLTIIVGIMLMILQSGSLVKVSVFRYIFGSLLIVFGIFLIIMFIINRRQLKIIEVFLSQASRVLKTNKIIFFIIPVFLILIAILIGLAVFQFLAFYSMGDSIFNTLTPYYQLKNTFGSVFLNILNIIEIFWGLNFLRQASFYISSGFIIQWYTQRSHNPIKDLIFKHWGSVVACGFMVGFFGILDMFYLLIAPKQNSNPHNSCEKILRVILQPFSSLSQFIRQQSMTYINLTGIPYCNASSYCQYLTKQSNLSKFQSHRPVIRYYRFGAYSFLVSILLIFCVLFQYISIGSISFLSVIVVGVLGFYVISGFIHIHADMASAILLAYLLENQIVDHTNQIRTDKNSAIRQDLQIILK